jgi:hypothetical protein
MISLQDLSQVRDDFNTGYETKSYGKTHLLVISIRQLAEEILNRNHFSSTRS